VAGNDSRVGDRQATSMRIKLKYPDVDTFIQKYAVNISRGGIFIATKQPKPVGTFVKFEFLLSNADSQSIIRGEGQVQWTKEFDPAAPARAHGMGVKFLRLDADSQRVVDRALRWRAEHGTSPNMQVPQSGAGSSAHATVITRDASQARVLPQPVPAREDLAAADDVPTAVRELSQSGVLPRVQPLSPEPDTQVEPLTEMVNPLLLTPEPPPKPPGRREDTRPIAINHDDDEPGRAPHQETRPITLPERRGGDEIDRLAREWGLSDEKLARSLKRARPRIVEATAELERLLLKPPKPPAPSRAEAMVGLAALLERRTRSGREPNGRSNAREHGERNGGERNGERKSERSDETKDEAAAEEARDLQRAP
jgi:uncharacterized protein (TIGR02266 family)